MGLITEMETADILRKAQIAPVHLFFHGKRTMYCGLTLEKAGSQVSYFHSQYTLEAWDHLSGIFCQDCLAEYTMLHVRVP